MDRPYTGDVSPFGRVLDGAAGTLVFGGGVPALVGDVSHTGDDDYLVVQGHVSGASDRPYDTYAVPLSSVVYFRWRPDEDGY